MSSLGCSSLLATGPTPVAGLRGQWRFSHRRRHRARWALSFPPCPHATPSWWPLPSFCLARDRGQRVSELTADVPAQLHPQRSHQELSYPGQSRPFIGHVQRRPSWERDQVAVEAMFGAAFGPVAGLDITGWGARSPSPVAKSPTFVPPGMPPELRAYTEADSPARAGEMNPDLHGNPRGVASMMDGGRDLRRDFRLVDALRLSTLPTLGGSCDGTR